MGQVRLRLLSTRQRRGSFLRLVIALALAASNLVLGSAVTFVGVEAQPAPPTTQTIGPLSAPGTPGVPQAPSIIYAENFENNPNANAILLTGYTGTAPQNETYTADPAWLTQCNGVVLSQTTPDGNNISGCGVNYGSIQVLAGVLGTLPGGGGATNEAVSAFTAGDPGANLIEFATVNPIPLMTTNHYITFSVDAAETSCAASHAALEFFLMDGATAIPTFTTPIDPCTQAPDVGGGVHAGTFAGNSAVFFTGSSLGIRMINAQGSGTGNDHAFDNIRVLDATPQLDKAFVPATSVVNGISILKFTITNTSELAAKPSWSFTDNLPAGLAIANGASATTTCSNGTVTATTGGTSIDVHGDLNAGQASCTASVPVIASAAGTYTNGPSNIANAVGVNLPGTATLTVSPAVNTFACDGTPYVVQTVNGLGTNSQLFKVGTAQTPYTFTSIGPINSTFILNSLAYNANNNLLYAVRSLTSGPNNGQTDIVTINNTGAVTSLGVPPGLNVTHGYNIGDITKDSSTYYLMSGAFPTELYAINLTTFTATLITLSSAAAIADFAVSPVDGLLYSVDGATDRLVQINPGTGAVQTFPFVGTPPSHGTGFGYGATWFTATGDLIAYSNDGHLFQIDLTNPALPKVIAGAGGSLPGPSSGGNDGAACVARPRTADLAVTKTASPSPAQVNTTLTYTLSVFNAGPDSAQGPVIVTDTLPAGSIYQSVTGGAGWSCAQVSLVVTCTHATDLVLGPAPAITIKITTPPNGASAINTATITSPTNDPNPTNNHPSVTTPLTGVSDLSIIKSSSPNPYVPGQALIYTITVTNNGPSNVTGAAVDDTLPAAFSAFNWICAASAPNHCGATSGTGAIHTTVDLVNSATAVFTLSGIVPSSTTGPQANTATVTVPPGTIDPNPGNNTATNNNPANVTADLSITKTSSPNPYVPGATLIYTVTVKNSGPSDVTGAQVSDPLPGVLNGAGFTWTCAATLPNACGTASGSGDIATTVNLVNGGTATFTVQGSVPPGLTGPLTNTATVTPPPGANDPNPLNNTAIGQNPVGPQADLVIAKTVSANPAILGSPLTYTVTATNNGPSNVTGAAVSDALPPQLAGAGFTWTCAPTSSCGMTAGTGSISTTVDLISGASVTFTVTGTVPATATGALTNTALILPPTGTIDPSLNNNTTTLQTPIAPATLAITSGPGTGTPGNPHIPAGANLQLTFTSGGQSVPASAVSCTASNSQIATVGADGKVHGITPGAVTVTCTYNGQTSTITVTVDPIGFTAVNATVVPRTSANPAGVGNQPPVAVPARDGSPPAGGGSNPAPPPPGR